MFDIAGNIRSLNRTTVYLLFYIVALVAASFGLHFLGRQTSSDFYFTYAATAAEAVVGILAIIVAVRSVVATLRASQQAQSPAPPISREQLLIAIANLVRETEEGQAFRRQLLEVLKGDGRSEA